jgi:hypothetical protein
VRLSANIDTGGDGTTLTTDALQPDLRPRRAHRAPRCLDSPIRPSILRRVLAISAAMTSSSGRAVR